MRLLYATGARVSELCNLQWRDLQAATIGRGQATLFGKGQRTRIVIFSASTWSILNEQRSNATDDDYVFRSRTGKRLHRTQIARILTIAATQAGITAKVSPHWLQHSHASHALERGTPSPSFKPPLAMQPLSPQVSTSTSVLNHLARST